jgi:hypothetical protein
MGNLAAALEWPRTDLEIDYVEKIRRVQAYLKLQENGCRILILAMVLLRLLRQLCFVLLARLTKRVNALPLSWIRIH